MSRERIANHQPEAQGSNGSLLPETHGSDSEIIEKVDRDTIEGQCLAAPAAVPDDLKLVTAARLRPLIELALKFGYCRTGLHKAVEKGKLPVLKIGPYYYSTDEHVQYYIDHSPGRIYDPRKRQRTSWKDPLNFPVSRGV